MWAATASTIRWADQRCTLRTYCPKGTSVWIVWMLRVRVGRRRHVEEHQVHAGRDEAAEQHGRDHPEVPRVAEAELPCADLDRVDVQQEARPVPGGAIARRDRARRPEDRLADRVSRSAVDQIAGSPVRRRLASGRRPARRPSSGSGCRLMPVPRLLSTSPSTSASGGQRSMHSAQRMQRSSSSSSAVPPGRPGRAPRTAPARSRRPGTRRRTARTARTCSRRG